MARIIGAIATSHTPTIGFAYDTKKGADPVWKPIFEAYEPIRAWLAEKRPGALLKFLESIGSRWNISLFHYRNHGSDVGRVLAGIQVARSERAELDEHLTMLRYPYTDETANPAYRMFLGASA